MLVFGSYCIIECVCQHMHSPIRQHMCIMSTYVIRPTYVVLPTYSILQDTSTYESVRQHMYSTVSYVDVWFILRKKVADVEI